ncbi:Uncharacterised protein [Serratia quinivorans]|uniref:DUF2513 domain-containing protein n=1 Tax=Serratia quinivorans TaxID=137545 RepID=UPI000F6D74F2|nr:DUF2513 domain-containing protein [Serratia quinivorans]VEI70659.1 Uncharacterised protein [Serratia quinivorans]
MRINQEYIKNLLLAFEDNSGPETDINELADQGFDYNTDEFIFHIRLLYEQGMIARADGGGGFGLSARADDGYSWGAMPLRLTTSGHEFITNLRQKEVWETVKTEFKDVASIQSLIGIAKSLATGFAKKKIKDLTGFDAD